jgi:acyl-CoA thioester hydrolase
MNALPDLPENGVGVSQTEVGRDWLDYNEHMNVAFYLKAFDDAGEAFIALAGMGAAYTRATGHSWVALESHLGFVREALLGDRLRIETRALALDRAKLHLVQALYRADELLATHEQLNLHFDTDRRRSLPFPPAVYARLAALVAAQRALPRPAWIGRRIDLGQGRLEG